MKQNTKTEKDSYLAEKGEIMFLIFFCHHIIFKQSLCISFFIRLPLFHLRLTLAPFYFRFFLLFHFSSVSKK